MKLLTPLVLCVVFCTTPIFSADLNSFENKHKGYAEVHAAAIAANKPIFLMFTASWCGPCQKLKNEILYKPNIWSSLNQHFIVHMIDVDKHKTDVELFKSVFDGRVPTIFFLDRGGKNFTGRHVGGFDSVQQFIVWYKLVHNLK